MEVVDFLRDPRASSGSAPGCRRAFCSTGRLARERRCSRRRSRTSPGANFYSASASSFVEMFAGLGAARIRKLFAEARKHAPAIIFIDELDAVGAQRTGHGFNREQDQTLNQLLVELDGFEGADQVVVMGASNRIQDLDQALLRPGRFDRQMLVPPPDLNGRERDPRGAHARQAARPGRRPGSGRAADERPHRRRAREHLQRGRDLRRPPRRHVSARRPTSTTRSSASSPACSRRRSSPRRSAASSRTTRPAMR